MIPSGARRMIVIIACLVWGALAVGSPSEAQAQKPDPGTAEELIRQANDLRRHGHDERALPLYRKAYEVARSARTAGQLGLAEMALGYWAASEQHLAEALAETRNPWIDKNHATLDTALHTAQSHLAELRVDGKPDGAEVVVNGNVVGTLPLATPVRVSEGRVELEVRAPGRRTMTRSLTLSGKAVERIQVSLDRLDTVSPTPQASARVVAPATVLSQGGVAEGGARKPAESSAAPDRGAGQVAPHQDSAADDTLPTWRRVLPWALLGGAVVAGSIGVWQQVASGTAVDSFDGTSGCASTLPNRGGDKCKALYDDFQSKRTHAYIGYGVAGVLGAGAITFFIVNAVSSPGTSQASASTPPVMVALDPSGVVFSYAARF
jgi:PEGA domain